MTFNAWLNSFFSNGGMVVVTIYIVFTIAFILQSVYKTHLQKKWNASNPEVVVLLSMTIFKWVAGIAVPASLVIVMAHVSALSLGL